MLFISFYLYNLQLECYHKIDLAIMHFSMILAEYVVDCKQ